MPGDDSRAFADVIADAYRIEREIGRGGWGLVYVAHDLRNDRRVAIKLLRGEFTGSVSGDRSRREIEILSRLHHPNIVALYDWGEFERAPWYAMSYVDGETLRARLDRERQLPIGEALRIAREVAVALAYAHSSDVVHRDVKPENILLRGSDVLVADFGIARAITHAATKEWITSSGVQIGTPAYMSPEQASAAPDVDGRSDIYSLGCVLYEMLTGAQPFSGSSPTALVARHVLDPVPPISTVRRSVPRPVEDVVYRALSKSPADRFATAAEFANALDAVMKEPMISVVRQTRRWNGAVAASVAAVALTAGGWTAYATFDKVRDARLVAEADTTKLVVFPFEHDASVSSSVNVDQSMRQAFVRWSGVGVIDQKRLEEASGKRRGAEISASEARSLALQLHAGRYVRGTLSRDGDTVHAHTILFDVSRRDSPLVEATETIPTSAASSDATFSRLADRLLLRTADTQTFAASARGTTSLPARQAFLRGAVAIEKWNLAAADSAFIAATRYDAQYASASLWLALARVWSQKDSATWYYAAEAAAAGRAGLDESDQIKADALSALAHGDRPRACALWDGLTRNQTFEFAAWYGAADCLAQDRIVLADATSPSGWRFRSGYHSALVRYRRAFARNPAVLRSLRNDAFQRVRVLLYTSGMHVRSGIGLSDPLHRFAAYPSWTDDTLSFIPFPNEILSSADPRTRNVLPRTVGVAVQRQQQLFHEIATEWSASSPGSAEAAEAVALSLFLLGEPSAIDTLTRAKALAKTPTERQRIVATEIWMRVQFALPGDVAALRRARALADSILLARTSDNVDPHTLASIAALTGHAFETTQIESAASEKTFAPPSAAIDRISRSLVILAAFGGPADSLRVLERRIDSLVALLVRHGQRDTVRVAALGRAATLAFPDFRLSATPTLLAGGMYLLDADAAFLRGDTARIRQVLAKVRRQREAFEPPELTLDGVFPEAWLIAAIGDTRGAVEWLDPTLVKLRVSSTLVDPVRAAMLVRAMAFRADLAATSGDRATAARWAAAVVELWSGADAFLQPLVNRMRDLAKTNRG